VHRCVAGQYVEDPGSYTCDECAAGDWSTAVGADSADTCQNCRDDFDRCFTSNAARDACDVPLDIDCVMDTFSVWGNCDTTCNEGMSFRTRQTKVEGQHTLSECHDGTPCPETRQEKICINAPCKCSKVTCAYEAHTCTDYSAQESSLIWGGQFSNGQISQAGIINGGYETNKIASAYVPNVNSLPDVGYMVDGDEHGNVLAQDHHDVSLVCGQLTGTEETIRVTHDKTEPLTQREAVGAVSTGHHCKYFKNATPADKCRCRCHSSFHHGYNPGSNDKWDFSCGQGEDENC